MNLRLSPDGIRFRSSREEFAQLLSGRAISLELGLPRDHVYRANVRPSVLGKWQLERDPTGLWLTIPAGELQALSEALPSREGLRHSFELTTGDAIEVAFEVDLKDQRRRSRSGGEVSNAQHSSEHAASQEISNEPSSATTREP